MESIATYQESAGGRKVRYTLFPDTIHCVGKNPMGMEFDTVVKLSDLRPEYATTRQYGLYFFYCLVLGVLLFIMASLDSEYVLGPHMQFLALGILGLGFLFFGRKISFVHFANHHGQILLSIARRAIDREKFDAFVRTLQEQIRFHQPNPSGS